jgi:hypothetical protein
VQRQIGQTDRDVPPVVGTPLRKIVEQRLNAAVAARRQLTPAFPNGPPHIRVHSLGEPAGQVGREPRSRPRRVVRRSCHHTDDDLRSVRLTVSHRNSSPVARRHPGIDIPRSDAAITRRTGVRMAPAGLDAFADLLGGARAGHRDRRRDP